MELVCERGAVWESCGQLGTSCPRFFHTPATRSRAAGLVHKSTGRVPRQRQFLIGHQNPAACGDAGCGGDFESARSRDREKVDDEQGSSIHRNHRQPGPHPSGGAYHRGGTGSDDADIRSDVVATRERRESDPTHSDRRKHPLAIAGSRAVDCGWLSASI